MLGFGAVNQETQYFGPGTRLLVLGELGSHARMERNGAAVGAGACGEAEDYAALALAGSRLTVLRELLGKCSGDAAASLCTGFRGTAPLREAEYHRDCP